MKTSHIIASFLCGSAIASPLTELRRERRALKGRRTMLPQNRTNATRIAGAEDVGVQYSDNWAGATLIGSGFTSVTGTVTVPVPKTPSYADDDTQYIASAWVGIDGDTCESAILQTGIDFNIQGGEPSYDAWFEWYPAVSYQFRGFYISAGDEVRMTVEASSKTAGKATIENLSTGQTVSHPFYAQSASLCGTNAEWIVEDASNGYGLVPFANFGTVKFTDAVAVSNGEEVDTSGAQSKYL
jgi:hypothetical protein